MLDQISQETQAFDRPLPPGVRIATEADEQKLYDCLMELYKDNFLGFPLDEHRVWEHIRHCCRGGGGTAAIIEHDNKVVATTAVTFGRMWYSNSPYLSELWLFCHRDYRKYGYPDRLVDFLYFYRDQCRHVETGRALPLISCVTSLRRLPAKMRWWRRWGRQVGATFLVDGA